MIRGRETTKRRSGVTLVESAICIGAAIFFMLVIFEYGRFFMMRHLVENAARDGARLAVVNTNTGMTTAQIQNYAFGLLANQSLLNSTGSGALQATDIQVFRADPYTGLAMTDSKGSTWSSASFGEGICVKINAMYDPFVPGASHLGDPVPVNVTSLMLSEGN